MLHCEHLEGGHSRSSEHQRQNYSQNGFNNLPFNHLTLIMGFVSSNPARDKMWGLPEGPHWCESFVWKEKDYPRAHTSVNLLCGKRSETQTLTFNICMEYST